MIPSLPRRLTIAAVAALTIILGGCGEGEIEPLPIHDLAEPWQRQPFAVEPSLITAAEKICRDTWTDSLPRDLPLVVVDARGANNVLLLFAGGGADNECFIVRDGTGRLQTTGGGGGSGPGQPPLGPNEVMGGGTGSQGDGGSETKVSYTMGRAGANVAAVEVVLSSAGAIRASLNRGFYAAWWPGGDTQVLIRGYDAGGNLIGSSQ